MKEIVSKVREAGVVGAGGGGFPTHVKLDTSVDIVLANGAECEPLLHCNQELMIREAERILEGLVLVQKATQAKRAIAVADAIRLAGDRNLEVGSLQVTEKQ